jgi:hypothetical protein
MRSLLLLACLIAAAGRIAAADGDAYRQVAEAMAQDDNRLPGSPGYARALDAIEATLTGAGLEPHRQTYDTLVPVTQRCRLKVDGAVVDGVHPLAPNGIAPPSTWGGPVSGKLVRVGDGSLAAMDGKQLDGCIAVLDFASPHLGEVLSQGARAVLLVGNDGDSQWEAEAQFTTLPVSMPCAWIDRNAAEAAGLLSADGTREASLDISVTWQSVRAANLWAKIPAAAVAEQLDEPESPHAMLLSATVDSFGAVPELCPQQRWAANAALLAEVAARLAREPAKRPVYVLFLGSHYGAQDGARQFCWAARMATTKGETSALDARDKELCQAGMERFDRQIVLLEDNAFVKGSSEEALELQEFTRKRLSGQVDDLNYVLSGLTLQSRQLEHARDVLKGEDRAKREAQLTQLQEHVQALRESKKALNGLRSQFANKEIKDTEGFAAVTKWLREQLTERRGYFERLQQDTRSCRELEKALVHTRTADSFVAESFAAYFAVDLAADDRPWMLSPFGADAMARPSDIGVGTFAKQMKSYADAWKPAAAGYTSAPLWFPDASIAFRYDALATPHQRSVPVSAIVGQGVAGFQLMTLDDPLDLDEMPVRAEWRLAGMASQLGEFVRAVSAVAELPTKTGINATPADKLVLSQNGKTVDGFEIVNFTRGTEDVEGPAANAILTVGGMPAGQAGPEPRYLLGATNLALGWADPTGHVFVPGLHEAGTYAQVNAFGFTKDGLIERFTVNGSSAGGRAALNFGAGAAFFTPFMPEDYLGGAPARTLVSSTDSVPKSRFIAAYRNLQVVFHSGESLPIKVLGNGIDMLGPWAQTEGKGSFQGLPLDPSVTLAIDPNRQAGHDLARLNLDRLQTLRRGNIINKPLEKLEADALDHLERADQARADGKVRLAAAHEAIASALDSRVYQPLRDNADDLVRAVVILLILCLPFAFAVERLIFGFTSIYKQIGGFMGVFMMTFGILYETHPAFALAEAPVIIFLAFVIILLSAFVIYVVMGKFRQELRAMQGLSSKVHGGQAEGGIAFAAVAIGISGMRNRPLKTFLTAATVALLTFTILVFASFSSTLEVIVTTLGASSGAQPRIEFHAPSFLGLPYRLLDAVSTLYGDRYDVRIRGASFRDPLGASAKDDVVNVALNPKTLAVQPLEALLVFDPAEVPLLDDAGRRIVEPLASADGDLPPLLLSQLVSEKLGVRPGDIVSIRGQRFRVGPSFQGPALKRLEHLDGTEIVPPNFDATFAASGAHADSIANMQTSFRTLDVNNFIFASPEMVGLTTPAGMTKLGWQANLITLYRKPGAASDVDTDARELAEWLDGPVTASTAEGAKRYFFTKSLEGSGFLEVLVPLLLGGLIIFSSLLGSIVDRQKEIFTFSALGLAPPDVAALFFTESAVFAVLGGMGGYLISQLVVKLLSLLASYGIVDVPEVNFSSFSSIVTILIVMATVMLSTIYPAVMAGRSANPGVARKWRMPKPEGDRLSFAFPFTVSAESIGGILAFIREHFENHGDASLGAFAARDVAVVSHPREGGGMDMGITAEIALAPFDLGVFQRFTMITKPSDIPGIDEVMVELVRLNGAPGTWVRGNRAFIDDLREQFLRWRSLPIDTVEHYQAKAEGLPGRATAGAVNG